jgi:hypothetical protein
MSHAELPDFETRRAEVMRAHILNHPDMRAARRRRNWAIVRGVLGYTVAVVLMLFLIKSMNMAMKGPEGYAQLVAPVLSRAAPGGIGERLITPGPVSIYVAHTLATTLPRPKAVTTAAQDPAPDLPEPMPNEG